MSCVTWLAPQGRPTASARIAELEAEIERLRRALAHERTERGAEAGTKARKERATKRAKEAGRAAEFAASEKDSYGSLRANGGMSASRSIPGRARGAATGGGGTV